MSLWPAERELNRELKLKAGKEENAQLKVEAAEAAWDLAREEHRALADAAGLNLEEYEAKLNEHGMHGAEMMRALREGRGDDPGEAERVLYKEAGDEAGETVDPMNAEFQKKRFWSKPMVRAHREEFDAAHPRRKKKEPSRKELMERGQRSEAQRMASGAGDDIAHELFKDTFD